MARKESNEEDVRSLRRSGMSERDAILTSVKRTKTERKKMDKVMQASPSNHEDYPYGLRIELDEETLKKLGVEDLPEAGETFCLEAEVKVSSSSEHTSSYDGEDTKTHRSVSLQITKMCLEPMDCADEDNEE